ncbi:hypothetical protein [Priestia aryabhattai]|uniref:hypothetical protein n=1 Tax=Priestia aryabhattai TaxID=412384 RepID=UPI0015F67E6E|nr:hypothetical protein [Priestia aryabhattai]
MKLEKVITYQGKQYSVFFELHNEEELGEKTISQVENKLIVTARVTNSNHVQIYKVKDRISVTDKNSLVNFLSEIVKKAHDKESLEQIVELDNWHGNIDAVVTLDSQGLRFLDPKDGTILYCYNPLLSSIPVWNVDSNKV